MDSRSAILARLPGRAPEEPAPGVRGELVSFRDPLAAFAANLEIAGGHCDFVPTDGLTRALAERVGELAPERVFRARGVPGSREEDRGPHELADLELAVLRGAPAVAESGAVWWVPADLQERAAAFLAPRVVFVVARDAVVDHLHAAYRVLDPAAAPFGCFVSGPSKTADIEQSLVIGAHGPRTLEVLLVG